MSELSGRVVTMKNAGYTEAEIAEAVGISVGEVRAIRSESMQERRVRLMAEAKELKDKGYSNLAIAQRMQIAEATVRGLLKPAKEPELSERRTALEIGLTSSAANLSVAEGVERLKAYIRKEQGFTTEEEIRAYWFAIPNTERVEIVKKALPT